MKPAPDALLKTALCVLILLLAVVLTSWITSSGREARGDGGGGAAGQWMMVASSLRPGEGLLYMFNTEKEVLLIYAFHRGRHSASTGRNTFDGDLQFLAGRHCRWDALLTQLVPFPKELPKSDMLTPAQVKTLFENESKKGGG